jgi:hypothetical protein
MPLDNVAPDLCGMARGKVGRDAEALLDRIEVTAFHDAEREAGLPEVLGPATAAATARVLVHQDLR